MCCLPRETSPRSFHSVILLPQVAHGRGGLLRCATAPVRRPGVIQGVTPPGSVLNLRHKDSTTDLTYATTTQRQTLPTPQQPGAEPTNNYDGLRTGLHNTTTTCGKKPHHRHCKSKGQLAKGTLTFNFSRKCLKSDGERIFFVTLQYNNQIWQQQSSSPSSVS